MTSTMTEEVIRYKETGEGWESLYDRVCIYSYDYPFRWSDWDEDRCSDFYMAFHPRIPGLIQRFQPDYTFETYLCCSLKWYMRTFNEKLASREHYEAWWTDPRRAAEDECGSLVESSAPGFGEGENGGLIEAGEDGPFAVDTKGRLEDPVLRRRILFIVLLRAADLGSGTVDSIAKLAGVDPDWLFECTEEIRDIVSVKAEKRERLRRRRNECWYRLDGATRRLKAEEACEGNHYREWKRKAQTWRNRYDSARTGLRKMKVLPSHEEIGTILDVPTGTVSSGIFLIRKAWSDIEKGTRKGFPNHRPSG